MTQVNNRLLISLVVVLIFNSGISQTSAVGQLQQNAISAQRLMDPAPKKYQQAKTLEKAGLWEEAEQIYRELNVEFPGVSKYFRPLRNILKQNNDYETLESFALAYSEANPTDLQGRLELGELYIWWNKPEKWRPVFDEIMALYPENVNLMKMLINKLVANGLYAEGDEYLKRYRKMTGDPYFYSLEMGSFYAIRMSYDKAMTEFVTYLTGNPERINIIRERILSMPEDDTVQAIVLDALKTAPVPEAKFILADVEFKNRHFRRAYRILLDYQADERQLLAFGEDLAMAGEFYLADSVLNNILETSKDNGVLERAIFQVAGLYELQTLQSLYLLPLSGFFRGNPFFSSPFLRVDESRSRTLFRAVAIYDSLNTVSNSPEAKFRLAEIRFRALYDLDSAEQLYTDLINQRQMHPFRLDSFLRLMDIAIARGDLQLAEKKIIETMANPAKVKTPGRNERSELKLKLAQVYFYAGDIEKLDELTSSLVKSLKAEDERLNEVLELAGITVSLKNEPDYFLKFAEIRLKLHQNKRGEALKDLEEMLEIENPTLSGMLRYQYAYLLMLQGDFQLAQEQLKNIPGESMYAGLGLIMWAEIEDYIKENLSAAIDGYLEFLEKYPGSIYYDDVRMRLRELAD